MHQEDLWIFGSPFSNCSILLLPSISPLLILVIVVGVVVVGGGGGRVGGWSIDPEWPC